MPDTQTGRALFQRNLEALRQRDSALAQRVASAAESSGIALEPARAGGFTARLDAPDAGSVYLHSRFDPILEARRFADEVCAEETFCLVVCGLGLGYHVRAVFDRLSGESVVVCAEPSVAMIAAAFSCVDLAAPLASNRLILLTDDDKHRLHERLDSQGARMLLGARLVQHGPSMRLAGEALLAISRAVTEYVRFMRTTLVTLVTNSQITCRNVAMNLIHYVTTPPIDLLRHRFRGDPAVVISAGPSLARNIEQLARLKGRAVLCAVQTALQPLHDRGIVPDFVTSLDYHEMSRKFFEGVDGLGEVHLVVEPKATWHVLDGYPGPVSVLENDWARMLIEGAVGRRDGLPAGATVAHLAFYLAVYMGCDPIILVGQDLAYTGHVYYVPGVEIHRAWRGELNRFVSLEQKEWERIARHRPILRRVPGNDGRELYSDDLLVTYREQFERDIAAAPCRVINATEGGARIAGAEPMRLGEAARRCGVRPIDPRRFAYRTQTVWRDRSRLGEAMGRLRRRMDELQSVSDVCDQLLIVLNELAGQTGDPARFNRTMARVDRLRARIDGNSRPFRLVSFFAQLAELHRFSADRRIESAGLDEIQRAARRIERDIQFATAIRDAARALKPILQDAVGRLQHPDDCIGQVGGQRASRSCAPAH